MADNEYGYLSSSAPDSQGMAKTIKLKWSGLNLTNTIESGELSDCNNISTDEAPYLTPCPRPVVVKSNSDSVGIPLGIHSLKGYMFILYIGFASGYPGEGEAAKMNLKYTLQKIKFPKTVSGELQTVVSKEVEYTDGDELYCSFNDELWDSSVPVSDMLDELYKVHINTGSAMVNFASYENKEITNPPVYTLIISPVVKQNRDSNLTLSDKQNGKVGDIDKFEYYDMMAVDVDSLKFSKILSHTSAEKSFFPYLTVSQSRLFGAGDVAVGASGYMNYGNWTTDLDYKTATQDGYGANHAWISTLQSNNHTFNGDVTAIAAYNGKTIAFKADAMYEIVNTKNPFRIMDVFEIGCIDNRSVQVVNGMLFFASEDGIYIYTGGKPQCISQKLNIKRITSAVAGTDEKKYYLSTIYTDRRNVEQRIIFVYDTTVGAWTKQSYCGNIVSMTYMDGNLFGITYDSHLYKLNTEDYKEQEWFAETDISLTDTNGNYTVMPKRINKLRFLAELDAGSSLEVSVIGADEDYKEDILCKKTYFNDSEETKRIPIRLNIRKKADYGFKVRVSGVGYAKVYSMEISYTDGGALDVTDREGISKA